MSKFNINQPDIQEIILRFLNKNLSEEDTIAFQKAMQENEQLKMEVEFARTLQSTLGDKYRTETKSILENITKKIKIQEATPEEVRQFEATYLSKPKPSFFSKNNLITIGIIGSVLVGLLLWLFVPFIPSQSNSDKIYKKFYEPYKFEEVYDSSDNSLVAQVLNAYKQKKYDSVISLLNTPQGVTSRMDFLLALGISYLEIGDLKSAEQILKTVSEDTTDIFAEKAQWYLALLYLKQRKVEEAKFYLNKLGTDYDYGSFTKEILNELPKNRFNKYLKK